MHPYLTALFRQRFLTDNSGKEWDILLTSLSEAEGELLQKAITSIGAETAVEVGMGLGVSSIFIADALKKSNHTRFYSMDPMQHSLYSGLGLQNIDKAGFSQYLEFFEKPSHLVLPELEERGASVDLGLIDGWHTFDHALLDFFYIDRMLKKGGIVVLDDTDMPAIRKLCRFILRNRAYKVFDYVPNRYLQRLRHETAKSLYNVFVRKQKLKDNLLPFSLFFPFGLDRVTSGGFVALQKVEDDSRPFNHFSDF